MKTSKFNKSRIFKAAWTMVKKYSMTISKALCKADLPPHLLTGDFISQDIFRVISAIDGEEYLYGFTPGNPSGPAIVNNGEDFLYWKKIYEPGAVLIENA